MNRITATQAIKSRWHELYPADGNGRGKGIICPLCKSGSGPNGTGISEQKGSRSHFLKCWNGGCDFNEGGSVIDLYMLEHNMNPETDFSRAVDELADRLNIVIDKPEGRAISLDGYITRDEPQEQEPPAGSHSFTGQTSAIASASAADPGAAAADPGQTSAGGETVEQLKGYTVHTVQADNMEEEPADDPTIKPPRKFAGYYVWSMECLKRSPEARAYLERRGISMGTATMYALGYDPEWVSPTVIEKLKAEGNSWRPKGTPRIIIPSGYTHYVARDIRPDAEIPEAGQKYKKMNEGSPEIFGLPLAMRSGADNIFVTEGAFDALSVIEAGQMAIALNSTSNVERLLKTLEENPIQATFIICLDSDAAGRKASAKLQDGLRRLNISCIEADINGAYKDPNEHLTADRTAFTAALKKAIGATAGRPDSAISYIENGGFLADIERRRTIGRKPTGFRNLDAKIGGGLRPGLFLLGAISSLGKTTFCSQLADGVAAAGNEVIYFSLEQSRLEMISKSLARETAKIDFDRAVTGGQIMDGYRADIVTQAARNYTAAVGDRISIIEAGMNSDTQFITDYVRNYNQRTGVRPVVIIDYLQIMAPGELPNGRKQDKRETVEECLRQLVLLKRELDLTIIAIVSLNRNNYLQPFDFESIKETGLAEYSADVVWGLQLQCLDDPLFSEEKKLKEKRDTVREAKAAIPRKVKLCSVKHRGQQAIYECNFDYYPQYDLFVPTADTEAAGSYRPQRAGKRL